MQVSCCSLYATVAAHGLACGPWGAGHKAPGRAFPLSEAGLLSNSPKLSGGGYLGAMDGPVTCPEGLAELTASPPRGAPGWSIVGGKWAVWGGVSLFLGLVDFRNFGTFLKINILLRY